MGEQRGQVSRVVTFLGIPQKPRQGQKAQNGHVRVTYRLYSPDGKPTDRVCKTSWIAVALTKFFRPREIHILATKEAWEAKLEGANRRNGEALVSELELLGVRVERVEIKTGISSTELWDQFGKMKSSLRGATDGGIVLDITHGLRSQPFFAGAVLTFVSMVDRDRPDIRVVYGAYDLIRTLELDHAPVLELTPFVELLDWTRDLVLFLESGRLGNLVERTVRLGERVRTQWAKAGQEGEPPRLEELGKTIGAFARDLQTIRTGALLLGKRKGNSVQVKPSSTQELLQAVERARRDAERYIPPLADVLDRIEAMARPLVFDRDHLGGADGHEVLAALVDLYLSMGRYVEAITTLREARISAYASPAAARPGLPGFDAGERDYTEKVLWPKAEEQKFNSISQLRNDINHAGYRRSSCDSDGLIDNIHKKSDEYSAWTPPEIPHADRILVNITNHPSDQWPEEQLRAALELTGRIVDIDFPRVGPDWSLRRIEDEAGKIIQKLPPGTTHALVQGEFTLTMELVRRLQKRGIRCLAATTERRVERRPDGREVRDFEFVRFRDYPKLA